DRRRHARGGACARSAGGDRHARAGQTMRSRGLEYRAAGRAGLSHRLQPAPYTGARRTMTITLTPGRVALADWRAIAHGADARLDPVAVSAIQASARVVDTIVAKGEPVYGINTGFGKLASVHIAAADLAALQRNIVLSHAAGVGEPMRNVRLMMALKLASLGRGASGVRLATVQMLEAMLARDVIPIVPSQGSVGASGDLAPLAHLAAVM